MTWWRKPKTPVPGQRPPARPPSPSGQTPAPVLPRRHGGVSYAITVWECGRICMWDGAGTPTWCLECKCPRGHDWQRWEQELAQ